MRAVASGWLAGLAMLLALALALLALAIREPDPNVQAIWLLGKAAQALIAGLLIGVLEEAFFRGALYTGIRRHSSFVAAAGWSALLYALLHRMKPHGLPPGTVFDWHGAAQTVAQVFTGVVDSAHVDSLVALFLAGVLLALVRERTGHIGWCIGLHAGWVFVIQLTRRLTDENADAALAFLVGGYDGVIGWLAAAWIAAVTLAFGYASRSRPM